MEEQVLAWVTQYGYVAIFCALVFGIIGLPIPDETMLTFTGYLIFKGHLSLGMALATAFTGAACGITISYILGRTFGLTLIHRYGRYLRITQEHVDKAHAFFERAGHWSLTFGYFIPGVRHFTAYVAGISCLEYPPFALFAYGGALLWVSTFIGLGYLLGERWQDVQKNLDQYIVGMTAAAVILALGYLVWRKWVRAKGK